MSHNEIDALFDEAHGPDFDTCPVCRAARGLIDSTKPTTLGLSWDSQIRHIHESSLRTQALATWLLELPPADGDTVTYTIEGTNPMTQPALPMTVEAAEIALTRELGFRLNDTAIEVVDFAEEDIATVHGCGVADLPMQRLWRAAVSAYVSLGNAEQREREMLVHLRTVLDELDEHDNATHHQAAEWLRALLPADGK